MKYNPLVSVVMPTYKRISCLQNAISSAVNQTYENIEIIVVNDGSSDKTGEIANKLSKTHKNVFVIHHSENKGYDKSLKDGFQVSKYNYLFFTDADRQFKIKSLDTFLSL